ncbi:MAG: hypothetical protein ACYDHD_08315 [Vulcanimicrobiaceae bacterium]
MVRASRRLFLVGERWAAVNNALGVVARATGEGETLVALGLACLRAGVARVQERAGALLVEACAS